ncbi:MAG: hypothetical protein A2X83_02475 [Desulfuromonadales bacterium GWD2_54_10]|nr:MAG: hypothetical protein A2X83_02475 [Desulfuromonadales bacterium GWD2_54_10]
MTVFTLRTKIIAGSVALILLIGTALFLVIGVEVHNRLGDEIKKRGVAIARHLADASVTPILTENTIGLQLLVNSYLKNEEDIRFIYIVTPQKDVLVHTFGKTFPYDLLEIAAGVTNREANRPTVLRSEEGLLFDLPAMIQHGELGTVHIGISEVAIQKNQKFILQHVFFYLAAVLLLGIIVAFWFATTITRPIAALSDAVIKVGRGELDGLIEIATQDEIGQLAAAFNTMTENLRQTTVSREYMNKLVNTMNDMLLVIAPDGFILSANRAFCEHFGYDLSELLGCSIRDSAKQDGPFCFCPAFERVFTKGTVSGAEAFGRTKSGNLMTLLFSLSVMKDEKGAIEAVICAAQDISAIKQVQESLRQKQAELESLNRTLEELVAVRTHELAVTNEGLRNEVEERKLVAEELQLARDTAEAANRAKTEFLANMSHEMRTPLNAIIGGADYLEEAALSDDQSLCLDMIHQAGNNLLVLVNDLIDLSRIEAGHLVLFSESFNVEKMLRNIIQMLSRTAQCKQLELSLDMADNLPDFLIGDQLRLQQILVNLVGNALKFTKEGSVTVSTIVGTIADDAVPITFVVRDTGIGIEKNKIEKIFETFTQADTSITRQYGGSGLGLTISRRLVEAMGGHLQVESEPGFGSSFFFTVLLRLAHDEHRREDADKQNSLQENMQIISQAEYDDAQPLVLLVDDALENRELIRLQLKKKSIILHEAGNGREALDMFEQNEYVLILMDIQMPIMDGYTATRLIRDIEQRTGRTKTPIVALTAHSCETDAHASIEAGCDDHITKPFRKEALLKCLVRYIDERQHV